MSDESALVLLAGPIGATALYWALYRYYRNTDKSHAFERETAVEAKPVTGADRKVSTVTGTRAQRISGDNVGAYRARVQRVRSRSEEGAPREDIPSRPAPADPTRR